MAPAEGVEGKVCMVTNNLGLLYIATGEYERGAELVTRAMEQARKLGDTRSIARGLNNLGFTRMLLGDTNAAAVLAREGLALRHPLGDLRGIVESLELIAMLSADPQVSAYLLGAATSLRTEHDIAYGWSLLEDRVNEAKTRAETSLGPGPFDMAWSSGQAASVETAVAKALQVGSSSGPPEPETKLAFSPVSG